jgi:hypothetical protein
MHVENLKPDSSQQFIPLAAKEASISLSGFFGLILSPRNGRKRTIRNSR